MQISINTRRVDCGEEQGFTVIEFLVSMLCTVVLMLAVVGCFIGIARRSSDHEIMARADEEARALLDYIAFDLRMVGSGMPLSQSGFMIDAGGLGDAPLPVLLNSDATTLYVRANETGTETVLTADYLPSPANLTLQVFSSDGFEADDTIYLSNMTTDGGNGLRGLITAVGPNQITIAADYNTSPSSLFKTGSLVSIVTTVTYRSPADWSGITRDPELGALILLPQSRFTISYLDANGAALPLPLTPSSIKNQLFSFNVNVQVRSSRTLSSTGKIYTAGASQRVAVRNLILSRAALW